MSLMQKLTEAREATAVALEREKRLMTQLSHLDQRASNAIAIEERSISEVEQSESSNGPALALSPFTWSAADGLTDDFWDNEGLPKPWVVDEYVSSDGRVGGETVAATTSSSLSS
jgi:hypothetical protein